MSEPSTVNQDLVNQDVNASQAVMSDSTDAGGHQSGGDQIPQQRWQIFPAQAQQAQRMAAATELSPLLAQVLINRGIHTPEQAWLFLDPETQQLPSPLDEFPDLPLSLELLENAISTQKKIAICGDYDADGMTSTALLIRALQLLGANANYAIPSRMQEGYGINERIVEDFHADGVGLILTVDNGIAAYAPIARARELGLTVIVTDHHDLPERLPPANAILNPKLLPEASPYRGIAGVGVAYVLAVCLAQCLQKTQDLTRPLLELFTLGTIADLAPLTGVNRRWVRRGLKLLPKSRLPGVQALIEVAGLSQEQKARKREAIGFRLGPRINAVGRIADPQIVIDMLTTEDVGVALQRAMQCEEANSLRQRMCELIETQAIEWCEDQHAKGKLDLKQERVLVVVQPDWHHGVIGIVASRLVERYGVPVFIGTYEDKTKKEIRGSARGIPEFNVFEALQACDDLLGKYGGHRAAGGFSFPARNLRQVKARLRNYAHQHLQPEYLKPLVTIDVQASLTDVTLDLYEQIDRLQPCGIENADPVFWTPSAKVVEQRIIGKDRKHLKVTLTQANGTAQCRAIAWRWAEYHPLPPELDIAYKLRLNEWRGTRTVELELVGVRWPKGVGFGDGILPWSAWEDVGTRVHEDAGIGGDAEVAETSRRVDTSPASAELGAGRVGEKGEFVHSVDVLPAKVNEVQKSTGLPRSPELPSFGHSKVSETTKALATKAFSKTGSSTDTANGIDASASTPEPGTSAAPSVAPTDKPPDDTIITAPITHAEFFYGKRRYVSTLTHSTPDQKNTTQALKVQNAEGHLLIVNLSERLGFLHLPGAKPHPVDLSEPHYFNLLRAGLNALEIKQKTNLLIQKDDLLAEKNRHIETLTQQVQLLEDKISQLSADKQQQFQALKTNLEHQETAIQGQEARIVELQTQMHRQDVPLPDTQEIKQQVRTAVGDSVWFCIQAKTQQDLCAAYKNYHLIQADGADPQIVDYSEAGIRLSFAIEREVVQTFFQDLYDFLLTNGDAEIGGLQIGPHHKYTLGMMPALLAERWKAFKKDALQQQKLTSEKALYSTSKATHQVTPQDRALLARFYDQWEHPMSTWFSHKGKQAATYIDQISRLRNIAAHAESFLYEWQYDLLRQLIVGNGSDQGLLQQIYGG